MNKSKKIATYGILIALAMIFSYIDRLIPFNFGIPGVKLGLANIVVIIAMYKLDNKAGVYISFVRIILTGFLFGNIASIMYSISGAILSLICMIIGKRTKLSIVGVSILGGAMHNMGQLLMAIYIIGSLKISYYGPVLLIAGTITGLLIGIVAKLVVDKKHVNY